MSHHFYPRLFTGKNHHLRNTTWFFEVSWDSTRVETHIPLATGFLGCETCGLQHRFDGERMYGFNHETWGHGEINGEKHGKTMEDKAYDFKTFRTLGHVQTTMIHMRDLMTKMWKNHWTSPWMFDDFSASFWWWHMWMNQDESAGALGKFTRRM